MLGRAVELAADPLDRDAALERVVRGQIDLTHAAGPEPPLDQVATDAMLDAPPEQTPTHAVDRTPLLEVGRRPGHAAIRARLAGARLLARGRQARLGHVLPLMSGVPGCVSEARMSSSSRELLADAGSPRVEPGDRAGQ